MVYVNLMPLYFIFNRLLPIAADLPITTALYNHPEEPERAGYTLNELLVLSMYIYSVIRVFND